MSVATIVLALIPAFLIFLNVCATLRAVRSDSSEPRQKLLQVAFIWLVPIIGAAVVWALLREPHSAANGKYSADSSYDDEVDLGNSDSTGDYFQDGSGPD